MTSNSSKIDFKQDDFLWRPSKKQEITQHGKASRGQTACIINQSINPSGVEFIFRKHANISYILLSFLHAEIAGLVINYDISNTIVLEIPYLPTKPSKWCSYS